jgi:predicted alpha/beta-fold hydrolase
LGGNIALKALGEYGAGAPATLRAAATVSVPIDLNAACTAIDERRENWIYRTYFLRRLARRYLAARAQRPDLFHPIDVDSIRGIRDWDNAVVAPLGGFADAEDYYARNSSLNVVGDIRVATLLIHAQDDPFIPFAPYEAAAVQDNDLITLLAPRQGGHVGFFSTELRGGEPDRYWAENRALAHCAAAVGLSWNRAPRVDDNGHRDAADSAISADSMDSADSG